MLGSIDMQAIEALERGACAGIIAACTKIQTQRGPKCIERNQIEALVNVFQQMDVDNYKNLLKKVLVYAARQEARSQLSREFVKVLVQDILPLLSKAGAMSDKQLIKILQDYATAMKWSYEIIRGKSNNCYSSLCRRILDVIGSKCWQQQQTDNIINELLVQIYSKR